MKNSHLSFYCFCLYGRYKRKLLVKRSVQTGIYPLIIIMHIPRLLPSRQLLLRVRTFYISTYMRHGSRYLIDPNDYRFPKQTLLKADSLNKLTATGKTHWILFCAWLIWRKVVLVN